MRRWSGGFAVEEFKRFLPELDLRARDLFAKPVLLPGIYHLHP